MIDQAAEQHVRNAESAVDELMAIHLEPESLEKDTQCKMLVGRIAFSVLRAILCQWGAGKKSTS